ncbi:MAG TPA: NAD-dependent DNA ligase LigA [Spirochaetota bacterium]|jgi:DNA ligase (NAD+)|nr:MAG: DNA ligase [Spirochaetes bacterium ADurb.Bin133]HNZ27604.1 NAD-dependent DNA ligase LigA [Spirochaetota bacterium]HPY86905.1 NAD-dependent DNA ligase LigA [Spirochaetota bacterium]
MSDEVRNKIEELREKINLANKAYYMESKPIISDIEYDRLFDTLLQLETEHPQYKTPDSPTARVGSDIVNELPEKEHSIPVLSLDKCYSIDSLENWIFKNGQKTTNIFELIVEPKIDGAGIVLYYENGILTGALTRGNGYFGNDITNNVKTIKTVPLKIDFKEKIAIRGEIFIKKGDFTIYNSKYADGIYSNPRNLASGCVRRLRSSETALFPLNIFCYEAFLEQLKIESHLENLLLLKKLGFPLNDEIGFFSDSRVDTTTLPFKNHFIGKISEMSGYIKDFEKKRESLPYEIDGIVIKINDLATRAELGYTQHHPRWAIAYKFDAPLAETKLESIDVQVGRGGRITPVANLTPVELSGSVISRATLHNQDYIDSLTVNVGDLVNISKRGDVIPAVEKVIEKGSSPSPYKIADACPSCKSKLVKEGAHLFCLNEECPARLLGTLQFFVGRDQMDIETLGDKTLEFLFNKGFVRYIYDLYSFDYRKLLDFEGFKDKKIDNIIFSIEKSKQKDFKTVISSLGLKDIGSKVAEILTKKFKNIDEIVNICSSNAGSDLFAPSPEDFFANIDGIGPITASLIVKHFTNAKTLKLIQKLKEAGLNFETKINEQDQNINRFLSGTKWVITGSFENFNPREKAAELIKKYGGETVDAVSSKTTHLLKGKSPGSKLEKAIKLKINIVEEAEFLLIIEREKAPRQFFGTEK